MSNIIKELEQTAWQRLVVKPFLSLLKRKSKPELEIIIGQNIKSRGDYIYAASFTSRQKGETDVEYQQRVMERAQASKGGE
jgi:hypothetical protein